MFIIKILETAQGHHMNNYTEKLFSYGTLQHESVQLSTFGRRLEGAEDILTEYHLSQLEINDTKVIEKSGSATHPILIYTGNKLDEVKGVVFDVSAEELQQADEYEVKDYKRVSVKLQSGVTAWVYVSA